MARIPHFLFTVFALVSLAAIDGAALAQPKDNDRMERNDTKGKKDGKEQKTKEHKHHNGKDLVGDKSKKNGKHEIQNVQAIRSDSYRIYSVRRQCCLQYAGVVLL